jgi:hypothetical protein
MSSAGRRRLLMVVAHVILIGGMAGGVFIGLRYAEQYTHGLDRYRQGPVKVVLRVKCHGGDPLMTVRAVESAGLAKDARVAYCKTESSTGLVVVESKGQQIRLSGDDVLPEWLMQFQYVRDGLVRRADALANPSAAPSADPAKPADGNDWFSGQTVARIAAALREDPFVEGVIQVDKQLVERPGFPGTFERQVVVTVALRKPLAHIFIDQCGYVVDGHGVVLERRDKLIRPGGGASAVLPQVAEFAVKAEWRRGLTPGTSLNAPDVQAGLDLLAKLAGQPFYREISEVNVANFDGRRSSADSELVLKTVSVPLPAQVLEPETILWGSRQDNLRIERNDTRGKIAILNGIWAQYGRLNLQDLKKPPYDLFRGAGCWYWIDPAARVGPATGGAASPRAGAGPWAGRP